MSVTKKVLLIISAVLAVAIVVVGVRLYYVTKIAPQSVFTDTRTPPETTPETILPAGETASPAATPEPTEEPIVVDTEFLKNNVNILMLGWDHSAERDDQNSVMYRDEDNNFRSDVMMLLSVNFEEKKADLISIPRDSYFKIYNTEGKWKINSAFAHGGSVQKQGFEYASKTVSALFGGIPINYYMGVDMIGLKAAVDAMGGVDYDVDVEIRLNGRVLPIGQQHLNGQQVLDYCRARKGISTDVGRVDRQQRMLFTIFDQLKSKNQIMRLPHIYLSVKDKVYTNLNIEQLAALSLFASDLGLENLNRHTLDGEYMKAYGVAFYVLHQNKVAKLAQEVMGVKFKPDPVYDYDYVKVDDAANTEIKKAQLMLETTISEEQKAQIVACAKAYLDATDEKKKGRSLAIIEPLYNDLLDAMYGAQWATPLPTDAALQPTLEPGTTLTPAPTEILPTATPLTETTEQ